MFYNICVCVYICIVRADSNHVSIGDDLMRRGILAVIMLLGLALMLVGSNLRYTLHQGSFYFDDSERARFVSMLHDAGLVEHDAHQAVSIKVIGPTLEVGSRTYTFRIASYRTDEEAAIGASSSTISLPVVVQDRKSVV